MRAPREGQVLGDVKIIDANFGFAIGDPTQWRLKRDLAGGGALMDVGIYCLQTARMLTGEDPIWISASEVKTDNVKFKEVDETITWIMKFPGGVTANCTSTYNANGFQGFRAAATGVGLAWIRLTTTAETRADAAMARRSTCPPTNDQFATELDDFADCILNKRQTKVSGEMGVTDVKFLMAVYESIRKGPAGFAGVTRREQ